MRSKWISGGCCAAALAASAFGAFSVQHGYATVASRGRMLVSEGSGSTVEDASHVVDPTAVANRQSGNPEVMSGNVAVEVPFTPRHGQIVRMCTSLAFGRTLTPSQAFDGLTAETGGTLDSTTDWCRNFLRVSGIALPSEGRNG